MATTQITSTKLVMRKRLSEDDQLHPDYQIKGSREFTGEFVYSFHCLPSGIHVEHKQSAVSTAYWVSYDEFFVKYMGVSPNDLDAPREVPAPVAIQLQSNGRLAVLCDGQKYWLGAVWAKYNAATDSFALGNCFVPRSDTSYAGDVIAEEDLPDPVYPDQSEPGALIVKRPITLHLTKVFTRGTLQGLAIPDQVDFNSVQDAMDALVVYQVKADRNGWHPGGWMIQPAGELPPLYKGIQKARNNMQVALHLSGFTEAEITIILSMVEELEAKVRQMSWQPQITAAEWADNIAALRTKIHTRMGTKAHQPKVGQAMIEFFRLLSTVEQHAADFERSRQ